jgi:hypothetical protein
MSKLGPEAADLRGRHVRIWVSGPRLFGGLVRPGISFALSELSKKPSRSRRGGEPVHEVTIPTSPAPEHVPLHARVIAWIVLGFAIYGFLALIGCVGGGAHAGTCQYYMDGADAVTSCEDGSYTVRGSDGKVRQYGERNGGFERYPGRGARPVFEREER